MCWRSRALTRHGQQIIFLLKKNEVTVTQILFLILYQNLHVPVYVDYTDKDADMGTDIGHGHGHSTRTWKRKWTKDTDTDTDDRSQNATKALWFETIPSQINFP